MKYAIWIGCFLLGAVVVYAYTKHQEKKAIEKATKDAGGGK